MTLPLPSRLIGRSGTRHSSHSFSRRKPWEYINPEVDEDSLRTNDEPTCPRPADVRVSTGGSNTVVRITDLTPSEKEDLKFLERQYDCDLATYQRIEDAGIAIEDYITRTVRREYLDLARGSSPSESTLLWIHHVVKALRQQYSPSEGFVRNELQQKYDSLKRFPPSRQRGVDRELDPHSPGDGGTGHESRRDGKA